jgi:uncharacterized membrane protein
MGQVNKYGNKFEGLFILPLVALAIYLLSLLLLRIGQRRFDYKRYGSGYQVIRTSTIASLAGLNIVSTISARGIEVDMTTIIPLMTGLLLTVIGNYLGKLRPNVFAGIRTPWTFLSNESWKKTHHVGGELFVVSGLSVVIASLLQTSWVLVFMVTLIITDLIFLTIYSYLVWKSDPYKRRLYAR